MQNTMMQKSEFSKMPGFCTSDHMCNYNCNTACMVQNCGEVNLRQIDHFRVLARKTLANLVQYSLSV